MTADAARGRLQNALNLIGVANETVSARNVLVQLEDIVIPTAMNSPDNQLVVLQLGGLGALVYAITLRSAAPELRQSAVSLLRNIVEHEHSDRLLGVDGPYTLRSCGGLAALLPMLIGDDTPTASMDAAYILMRAATVGGPGGSANCEALLGHAGALQLLLAPTGRNHDESPNEIAYCAEAVAALLNQGGADAAAQLQASGGVAILHALLAPPLVEVGGSLLNQGAAAAAARALMTVALASPALRDAVLQASGRRLLGLLLDGANKEDMRRAAASLLLAFPPQMQSSVEPTDVPALVELVVERRPLEGEAASILLHLVGIASHLAVLGQMLPASDLVGLLQEHLDENEEEVCTERAKLVVAMVRKLVCDSPQVRILCNFVILMTMIVFLNTLIILNMCLLDE